MEYLLAREAKDYLQQLGAVSEPDEFPRSGETRASRIDYARTQNAGEDLRFVDADDATVLDREIEEEFLSYV